jgi:beta-mannosidase
MGTLYWQLNDCWPVASWSSIDYHGTWKALQYKVRGAFAPVLISPTIKDRALIISVVSDRKEAALGIMRLRFMRFDGEWILPAELAFAVDPERSVECFGGELDGFLGGNDPRSSVLEMELVIEGKVAASKIFCFVPPKELALDKPRITAETICTDNGYDILLSTDTFAKNVFIDLEGKLSDNYFDLLPGRVKRVSFVPSADRHDTLDEIEIMSLYDTYEEVVK